MVERDCLLFEAGDYPDRGVTITEDDLREIARNTPESVPVRIEHLAESPFDSALGVVTRLRVHGGRLWATLRQPVEAWRLVRRAGATALSVALDIASKQVREVSFVCRPRVADARVFGQGTAYFMGTWQEGQEMAGVRQFAESVVQFVRSRMAGLGADEACAEREAAERDRAELRRLRVERQMQDFKERGLVRGTEEATSIASALLSISDTSVTQFSGSEEPISVLFARFLEANGAVVPMGEIAPGDVAAGGRAAERLMLMAEQMARKQGISYVMAFGRAARANPELARAAREEAQPR
jgi:hypothetical protein